MNTRVLICIVLLGVFELTCESPQKSVNRIGGTESEISRVRSEIKKEKEVSENRISFEEKVAQYEAKDREFWQKPDAVVDLLGPLEGLTVAEIGAGSGYFTFRLLPEAEKVIAIDIDKPMLDFIEEHRTLLPKQYSRRLETRLATVDDPKLDENEVDIVFLVNTYMFLEDRVKYFRKIHEILKPGGKIVIIDFKKRELPQGPPSEDKIPLYLVEQEMFQAGFNRFKSDDQTLPYQYIYMGWI